MRGRVEGDGGRAVEELEAALASRPADAVLAKALETLQLALEEEAERASASITLVPVAIG